jgi:hypothetical protein
MSIATWKSFFRAIYNQSHCGATIPNSRTVLGAGAKASKESVNDLEMAADLAVASPHHVLAIL